LRYRDLSKTHPSYDPQYWDELRALYAGGAALLRDDIVMARLFPKNANEPQDIYKERCQRAEYPNFAGSVVDYICASLFTEPLALSSEPDADPFFMEFQGSVDGHAMSLTDLLKQQALTSLQLRTAWTLVDLPPRDEGAFIESEADEEAVGQLRAFALPLDPEHVLDWDETSSGDLEWALIKTTLTPRKKLTDDRSIVTERFTYYTRDSWERFEVSFKKDKPPKPGQEIPQVGGGSHTFGKVPLARMQLPKALWAMDQLHNLAKTYLNKASGLSWSEYRHFFPILSAHLAPSVGPDGATENENAADPGRATNQTYGPGRIIVLGDKDKLMYTSPDPTLYADSQKRLEKLRDEMYRVVHQMALAIDNTGAGLRRSAESKQLDRAAAAVVLTVLGEYVRQHAIEVLDLAARGRLDNPLPVWTAHGMQSFDLADLQDVVKENGEIDALRIPSQKFQVIRTFNAAKRIIRGNASPQELDVIKKELEANIDISVYGPPGSQPQPMDGKEPDGDEAPQKVAKGVARGAKSVSPAGKEISVGDTTAKTPVKHGTRGSGTGASGKGTA
jgi:hypothetical protein